MCPPGADTSVGPYGFVRTQGTKLRHVVHSPTFTTARESGEYCQQTACVFSTNAHTTVVLHRGATFP